MSNRKIIVHGVEARERLAKGAETLAKIIQDTLGPFGANVFLEKGSRPTNDGKKIAVEIQLNDEIENMGAKAIREPAIKVDESVGDGTTTAVTLAWAIYQAASRFLAKKGTFGQKTPSEVVRQIEKERQEVEAELKKLSMPIENEQDLINSAIVSVEDKELGNLIGKMQWKLGKDGFLIAEESNDRVSSIERVDGIKIDNGFSGSSVHAINNRETGRLELDDVPVVLTSYTINDFNSIEKFLNQFFSTGKRNIVIIARAWTEEAIRICQANNDKGYHIFPMNAPYVNMQERFKDMVAITGAKFYDSENSNLSDLSTYDVGILKRLRASRYDSILAGSSDVLTKDRIGKRVNELKETLKGDESEFMKKMTLERISQLKNGFAIIKVGSPSDMERKRLFDKCEDAVNAVRAAFQEGTVKGGGLAFKEISEGLPDDYILKKPLMSIYEQIMLSAPQGFVIEDWVRDPVKVMRIALEKACAAASALATAGGAIHSEWPKPLDELLRKNAPPGNN